MALDIYKTVGARLQALRKAHGMTQNELAERADLAVSYLVKLEAGVRKARLETLARLAKALDEPVWRFLADERLTPDETVWRGAARKVADAIRGLPGEDVDVLADLVRRLRNAR